MILTKNCAKAVIIQDKQVLLLKKIYEDGRTVFTLPGGTQEPGEPLEETAVREVFEEVAARVHIKKLLKVYEHRRPSKSDPDVVKHKVEFAFLCDLIETYTPQNGHHPDPHQHSVEWISINDLSSLRLDPPKLEQVLSNIQIPVDPLYAGDLS